MLLERLRAQPVGEVDPRSVDLSGPGLLELDTVAGGVDIHLGVPGAPPYPQLRSRALEIELDGIVPVASVDDLIAMRRASGRPIDRSDILALSEPDSG